MDYAIKVVQKNGEEDFLCDGLSDRPTRLPSYAAAYHQRDFLKIGMEGDAERESMIAAMQEFIAKFREN